MISTEILRIVSIQLKHFERWSGQIVELLLIITATQLSEELNQI